MPPPTSSWLFLARNDSPQCLQFLARSAARVSTFAFLIAALHSAEQLCSRWSQLFGIVKGVLQCLQSLVTVDPLAMSDHRARRWPLARIYYGLPRFLGPLRLNRVPLTFRIESALIKSLVTTCDEGSFSARMDRAQREAVSIVSFDPHALPQVAVSALAVAFDSAPHAGHGGNQAAVSFAAHWAILRGCIQLIGDPGHGCLTAARWRRRRWALVLRALEPASAQHQSTPVRAALSATSQRQEAAVTAATSRIHGRLIA